MEIDDLNVYGQDELQYFKCLTPQEKISFLDSVYTSGISNTLADFISREQIEQHPLSIQTIQFIGIGELHVMVFEDEIVLYSDYLKLIRMYVKQLFHNGNILVKQQIRKPRDIEHRYYAHYTVLNNTLPLCPN